MNPTTTRRPLPTVDACAPSRRPVAADLPRSDSRSAALRSRSARALRSGCVLGALLLAACGPPRVEIVRPPEGFAVDAEVSALVNEKVAAVEAAPGSAAAHGELGLTYEANQLWSLAQRAFRAAGTLDPDEPDWLLHEAVCLRESGDAEGSLALFREAARRLPNEPSAHERLAQASLAAGELAEAEAGFRRVVALADASAEGHVGLAEVALARGNFEPARQHASTAVQRAPDHKGARFALGQALQGLGRTAEAERELNLGIGAKARWLALPRAMELRRLGVSYADKVDRAVDAMDAGAHEAAVSILEELRRGRPDDITVLNNLGAAYTGLKRHEEAESTLRHALEVDEARFETHINMATALLEQQRLDAGLVHADRAVELAPEVGRAHYVRAKILALSAEFPLAYAAMRRSAELDSRDPMIHVALGELSMRLEVWPEARMHFKNAVERMPDHLPSYVNLVKSLTVTGELEEADRVLLKLEAGVQEDLPILRNLRAQLTRAQAGPQ